MAYKIKNPTKIGVPTYNQPVPNLWITQKKEGKKSVKSSENLARNLMAIDSKIWNKHGWESGNYVNQKVYKAELKAELDKKGITTIPYLQYHILEDANFHTLNKNLEALKMFKKDETYGSTEKEFEEYQDKGGKTWDINLK